MVDKGSKARAWASVIMHDKVLSMFSNSGLHFTGIELDVVPVYRKRSSNVIGVIGCN